MSSNLTLSAKNENEMEAITKMRSLFDKGQTNPSACAAICIQNGIPGRFTDLRKTAEYEYKMYSMEKAAKKRAV